MLGCRTKYVEPAAVMAAEGHDQDQYPISRRHEKNREEEMARQHDPRPVAMSAAEIGIGFW